MGIAMYVVICDGVPVRLSSNKHEAEIVADYFDNAQVFPMYCEIAEADMPTIGVYAEDPADIEYEEEEEV